VLSAVNATKNRSITFDSMADNAAGTMRADGRQGMNGAFEAIKRLNLPVH
jgi:hypothetical protein